LFAVLIEGVLFRARYLGSTQLISDGQPSKAVRMLQAQEAIGRIKVQATWCSGSPFFLHTVNEHWQQMKNSIDGCVT